jgi:hypothetical protein
LNIIWRKLEHGNPQQGQRCLPGNACERRILFQMQTKLLVTLQGALALSLGQLGQRRDERGVAGVAGFGATSGQPFVGAGF